MYDPNIEIEMLIRVNRVNRQFHFVIMLIRGRILGEIEKKINNFKCLKF